MTAFEPPTPAEDAVEEGIAHQKSGNQEKALASFERALTLDADHTPAHEQIATVYEAQGRFKRALWHYQCALDLDTTQTARIRAQMGEALRKSGDYDQAIEQFDKALVQERTIWAVSGKAECLRMLMRNDQAHALFEEAVAMPDAHEFALQGHAANLIALKRVDEARRILRQFRQNGWQPNAFFEGLERSVRASGSRWNPFRR